MTHPRQSLCFSALVCTLPSFALANPLTFKVEIDGYQAKSLQVLPQNQPKPEQDCRRPTAVSQAAKAVEAAGWQVISEVTLAGYDLVSFAAESSIGPSGVCEYSDSNLSVFSGDKLQGLFWGQEKQGKLFGSLEAASESIVTINHSAFPVVPVAELAFAEQNFILQALPATFKGCDDQVEVPNLWMEPIGKMREGLMTLGWKPLEFKPTELISEHIQSFGFKEVESCSGTGQNYCSFEYQISAAKLRVITIGEMGDSYQPMVVDYELLCQSLAE